MVCNVYHKTDCLPSRLQCCKGNRQLFIEEFNKKLWNKNWYRLLMVQCALPYEPFMMQCVDEESCNGALFGFVCSHHDVVFYKYYPFLHQEATSTTAMCIAYNVHQVAVFY